VFPLLGDTNMGFASDFYNSSGSGFSHGNCGVFLAVLFGSLFLCRSFRNYKRDKFAVVNDYPRDWTLRRAHDAFLTDARGLILDGFRKVHPRQLWLYGLSHHADHVQFQGPFRIITTLGSRVILPADYTEWLKNSPDLDHQAFASEVITLSCKFEPITNTAEEFFAGYPGFEGESAVADPSGILITVIKNKLAQNWRTSHISFLKQLVLSIAAEIKKFHDHVSAGISEAWGGDTGM
jgi:hypothetical protein